MSFLFHPHVTLASLIALFAVAATQTLVIAHAEPTMAILFGPQSAHSIALAITKLSAACSLLTILLGTLAALGRSPIVAVDQNKPTA